jgi:hypothetical protein
MEDLLVDEEQWIIVDPSTWPTNTLSTSTHATLPIHKLPIHHLLVC